MATMTAASGQVGGGMRYAYGRGDLRDKLIFHAQERSSSGRWDIYLLIIGFGTFTLIFWQCEVRAWCKTMIYRPDMKGSTNGNRGAA